jgi:hypothetical protein
MAGADRMAIEEIVRNVLVDEHADVLRESVEWLAGQSNRAAVTVTSVPVAVSCS